MVNAKPTAHTSNIAAMYATGTFDPEGRLAFPFMVIS